MFGFSRGAATTRAFNGFIDACGLIDGRDKGDKPLKDEVKKAIKAYRRPQHKEKYLKNIKMHEMPNITFIGVWDTVSALGFPDKTDKSTFILAAASFLFKGLAFIADKIIPHKYYNYELTPNIQTARQALAIDDERTAFWPKVWNEQTDAAAKVESVDQVWFSGMHSNMGGGYERAGLANTSFYWMLTQIKGIKFKPDTLESAAMNANVNGRLYNSRQDFASFYRYHPRDISTLCSEAKTPVKVHESVIKRLEQRTANYAPRLLPEKFIVVNNQGTETNSPEVHSKHWEFFHARVERMIGIRKFLYGIQVDLALILMIGTFYFKDNDVVLVDPNNEEAASCFIKILDLITPSMMEGFIKTIVIDYPRVGISLTIIIVSFLFIRWKMRKLTTHYAAALRKLLLNPGKKHPDY